MNRFVYVFMIILVDFENEHDADTRDCSVHFLWIDLVALNTE